MGPPKMTITVCSVVVAVGVLAWNPTATDTSSFETGLCIAGVGVGPPRGSVVELCQVGHRTFTALPTAGHTQSPPPSPARDLLVEISAFNTHRILMNDALRMMIP